MARFIELKTHTDARGSLTSIEEEIGFAIRRVYYIYNTNEAERGGHRHKKNKQALICLSGSCEIYCNNGEKEETFALDRPNLCLAFGRERLAYYEKI